MRYSAYWLINQPIGALAMHDGLHRVKQATGRSDAAQGGRTRGSPGQARTKGDDRAMAKAKSCTHLGMIRDVTPSGNGCKECLEMGDTWVHLRLCLTCGHVGCCDSSKNKHATKHFHATSHPIIQSFEPGEDWRWCYVDEMAV